MKTRVHRPTPAVLRQLARVLRRGELVAIPTETVYGLAANALDARACRKIFSAKQRPADDPLIVHVTGFRAASELAKINNVARVLIDAFWPGPLTLVLPKKPCVPDIVTSGQSTVAIRAPIHPLARKLLQAARIPLAAPSANPFGYISPTQASHVMTGLGGRIGHILDGGACEIGLESTIVDATDPARLVVLRPGAVSDFAIRRALRAAGLRVAVAKKSKTKLLAPGLLDKHYSPQTPLSLVSFAPRTALPDTAVIYWKRPKQVPLGPNIFALTRSGQAEDAARNLYSVLRTSDESEFKSLICEKAPPSAGALGEAINDRLTRAASKRSSKT